MSARLETTAAALTQSINLALEEQLPGAIALRRDLHQQPDLGGEEGPTTERVRAALPGFDFVEVAGTGMVTRVGPDSGPAVVLRVELDALPIEEETGVPWAARNGAMHGCGHDVHMAAAVSVLKAASRIDLPRPLVVLFQPREESYPSGALDVLESKVLDDFGAAAVIGAHVQPQLPPRTFSAAYGAVNAASDEFEVIVHGRGGHGAYPHATIDPVPAAASIAIAYHEIISRKINPMHPTALSIGSFHAGSSANVIPPHATLSGILRCTVEADRRIIHDEIRNVAHHIAASRGASAEVMITSGEPVMHNDSALVKHVGRLLETTSERAVDDFRSCGSDDFSYLSATYPGLMIFVGPERVGEGAVLHHPAFLPADTAIGDIARALAAGYAGALAAREEIPFD